MTLVRNTQHAKVKTWVVQDGGDAMSSVYPRADQTTLCRRASVLRASGPHLL
jgi:hypothetical protein